MKYLCIAISVFICIFAFYTPNVRSQTNGLISNITMGSCETYNNTNCTACLKNLLCYWCEETVTCHTIDFEGFISTTCPVEELFVTQCVLNGLYSIIIVVAAVLILVAVFLCMCITCCICCCWCLNKKKNYTEDKQQLQMEQMKDSKDAKKLEREQRRMEIRNKYL